MISHTLLTLALAGFAAAGTYPDYTKNRPSPAPNADPTDTTQLRLDGKRWTWPNLPHMADTLSTERGVQVGFNDCSNATAGPTSMCQTAIVNGIDDFCLYAPETPTVIGDAEAGVVTYCVNGAKWGTRQIPAGALTGVQFLKAKNYISIMGHINQAMINVPDGDSGGELDNGGQDQRGNPIGGLMYSNNLPGHEGTMTQIAAFSQFIGGNVFCIKMCGQDDPNGANDCEHVYDTIGCSMNNPGAYEDGVFLSCASDNAVVVGALFASNTVILPATSDCTTYQSASLYAGLPSGTVAAPSSTASAPAGNTGTSSKPASNGSGTSTKAGGASSGTAAPTTTPGAASARISVGSALALLPVLAGLVGAYLV